MTGVGIRWVVALVAAGAPVTVLVVACGSNLVLSAVPPEDGSTSDAVGVDAVGVDVPGSNPDAGRCNTSAPFVRFEPVAGLESSDDEELPRLSRDERAIYFYRVLVDSGTATFVATRTAPDASFGTPNQAFLDVTNPYGAVPSADHRRVYMSGGTSAFLLLLAERTNVGDGFGPARVVFNGGATSYYAPALVETPDARPKLFVARGDSDMDLWSADIDDAGAPKAFTAMDNVNQPGSSEYDPTPSADGLTLYFFSDRGQASGAGRVYVATRETVSGAFGPPGLVEEITRPPNGWVSPGFLSVDQCRLYYYRAETQGGRAALFVASRDPE
jgi:hypothetical protein